MTKIRCCDCNKVYDIEIYNSISKELYIICPFCGLKHTVDFAIANNHAILTPIDEIKLGATDQPILFASRILNSTRVAQAADDTDVADWDTANEFIVAFQIDEEKGPWTATYKIQWSDVTDASAYVDLATTGELIQGTSTDLVNGNAVTIGEKACDATGALGSTWADGEEVEGANLSDSITLADEEYTEIHFAVNPVNANEAHKYSFRLWENTNGSAIGIALAEVTTAAGAVTHTKAGSVIGGLAGSGIKLVEFTKTGSSITNLIGAGIAEIEAIYEKTGSGITNLVGSGTSLVSGGTTFIKTGGATSVLIGSGSRVVEYEETGSGITVFVGSGYSSAGATYEKAGTGISVLIGTGTKAIEYAEDGAGVLETVGGGTSSTTATKTGTGILELFGSGAGTTEAYNTYEKAGTGISGLIGDGTDIAEYTKAGYVISEFVGSGINSKEFIKEGTSIASLMGSGYRILEYNKEGSAIMQFYGVAEKSMEYAESGTGILGMVGGGVYSTTATDFVPYEKRTYIIPKSSRTYVIPKSERIYIIQKKKTRINN